MYLYNTFSKQKEKFTPRKKGKVNVYSCGPTVYSHPHIGNFRSFVAADILRRYLEYRGYQVKQVMNITDVGHMTTDDDIEATSAGEDKIQAAARKEKKTPEEITRFYEQEFLELAKLLNLEPATVYPRATEHIPEMIALIKKLIAQEFAYNVGGNVYYEVAKFKNYGQLSGNPLENLLAGARIEVNKEKRHPIDFALWKQDPKHLMQWDSPWGKGFPGWHIECSAMSLKYLGNDIDIHTGGEDNIFPHHESEIAQSEAANQKKFVHYWFHVRHLLVNNQKMSKSAGNFYTVRDILDKGYDARVLRYALGSVHYRKQLNFTFESLDAARQSVYRLRDFKQMLEESVKNKQPNGSKTKDLLGTIRKKFEAAMDDDLNISEGLAAIFDLVREINKVKLNTTEAKSTLDLLNKFDTVLGILESNNENLGATVEKLIEERKMARENKNYQRSDEIRKELDEMGIVLEDTGPATRWKKKL